MYKVENTIYKVNNKNIKYLPAIFNLIKLLIKTISVLLNLVFAKIVLVLRLYRPPKLHGYETLQNAIGEKLFKNVFKHF